MVGIDYCDWCGCYDESYEVVGDDVGCDGKYVVGYY